MNAEKFNELIKTIDDNVSMLNYIIMPDGKLVLACEFQEDGKHHAKTWNNIQPHDEIITKRLEKQSAQEDSSKREMFNDCL